MSFHRFDLSVEYPGFALRAKAEWSASRAALFGPSGSGKSTLLEAILGLRPSVRGSVQLHGRELSALPPEERALGWVPQEGALFPHRTVRENLLWAAPHSTHLLAVARGLEIAELLGRRPAGLSGGERQRVALGRALLAGRSYLLLDEPLSSLDRPLRERVGAFLLAWAAEHRLAWLLVSHDPEEVLRLCSETLLLRDGRVEAVLPTREALAEAFLGALSLGPEGAPSAGPTAGERRGAPTGG